MRYRWDPPYPSANRPGAPYADSALRASDAERSDVTDALSRHYADGRLDQAEFKARLDRAMGATTRGQLAGLFDDLPPLAAEAPVPPVPPARRRLPPVLLVVAVLAVVAASGLPYVHIPWLLLALLVLFVWGRTTHRHRHHHHHAELDR